MKDHFPLIRSINVEDTPQLKYLLNELYVTEIKNYSLRSRQLEAYINNKKTINELAHLYLTNSKLKIFVAELNNKLIGFIRGEIVEKPHRPYFREGHLNDWFVLRKYSHQKIGKKLYKKLVDYFEKNKCHYVELEVQVENYRSRKIYSKLGFWPRSITMVKKI